MDDRDRSNKSGRDTKKAFFFLFTSIEGRILSAGCAAAVLYAIFLVILFFISPSIGRAVTTMTITHILFGRAAGMSYGYTKGLPGLEIIIINMIIETLVVVLFYPLFVLSWKKLLVLKPLSSFMEKIRNRAEKNKGIIRKFGIAALAIFVFIPFWMTGPIVGSAIGFLLGFPWWLTFSAVLGGTYVAVIIWGVLLRGLFENALTHSPLAPVLLLAVIIVLSAAGHIINRILKK